MQDRFSTEERSYIAKKVEKLNGDRLKEEVELFSQLLRFRAQRCSVPDILNIVHPQFRVEEQEIKAKFNSNFKKEDRASFGSLAQKINGLSVLKIVEHRFEQSVSEQTSRSDPMVKYLSAALSMSQLRIEVTELILMSVLKVVQAFEQYARQKKLQTKMKSRLSSADAQNQNETLLRGEIALKGLANSNEDIVRQIYENTISSLKKDIELMNKDFEKKLENEKKRYFEELKALGGKMESQRQQLTYEISRLKEQVKQIPQLRDQRSKLEQIITSLTFRFNSLCEGKKKLEKEKEELRHRNFEIKEELSNNKRDKIFCLSQRQAQIDKLESQINNTTKLESEDLQQFKKNVIQKYEMQKKQLSEIIASLQQALTKLGEEERKKEEICRRKLEQDKKAIEKEVQNQLREENSKMLASFVQKTQNEVNKVEQQMERLQKSNQQYAYRVSSLDKIKECLLSQNESLRRKLVSAFEKTDKISKFLQKLTEQLQKKLNDVKIKQEQLRNQKQKNELQEAEIRQLKQKLKETQFECTILQSKNKGLLDEIQEIQADKQDLEQRLDFSQKMVESLDLEKSQIELASRVKDEKINSMQKQASKMLAEHTNSTILTVSPILEGKKKKANLLIKFIQDFVKQPIFRSQLKYRYEPINLNFGYYLEGASFPFVLLFELKSDRVMGVFSTGLLRLNQSQVPQAFLFSLQDEGCMFTKVRVNLFNIAAKFVDNTLSFGNSELCLRNNSSQQSFQLRTTIFGDKYFNIRSASELTGESSDKFSFKQMEIHQIYY